MNKRIRELAEHAHEYALEVYDQRIATEGQGNVLFYQIRDDKYAELIVQECISINRQRMFSDYEGDSHRVAHNNALLCANSDMFEHFGVEEN